MPFDTNGRPYSLTVKCSMTDHDYECPTVFLCPTYAVAKETADKLVKNQTHRHSYEIAILYDIADFPHLNI